MTAPTFLRSPRSIATQVVAPFTGEGAYHGSTKPRRRPPTPGPAEPVAEMRGSSLAELGPELVERGAIPEFEAVFPNRCEIRARLPVPSQAAIRDDGVTFCWCPLSDALAEAGPVTREVLELVRTQLDGRKRYVYVDSKIQYFEPGDVPVDSQHWHVDGSISVRGPEVERLGFGVLHDMKARMLGPALAPQYWSYQSSDHCATEFCSEPVALNLPALIPNFDELDRKVRSLDPARIAQPAGAVVGFDGLSLHRAVAATGAGWRLWVRCVETDRQVTLDADILGCYATVFRHSS